MRFFDKSPFYYYDDPTTMPEGVIFKSKRNTFYYKCPCGCGSFKRHNFANHTWIIENVDEITGEGVFTLNAKDAGSSILEDGCKAHYFLKNNKITWA